MAVTSLVCRVLRLGSVVACLFFSPLASAATYWLGANSSGFGSPQDACRSRLDGAGYTFGSVSGDNCLDDGGRVRSTISSAQCDGVLKKGALYLGYQTYSCVSSCPSGVAAVGGYCNKDCSSQPSLGSSSTRWTYSGPYPGFGGGYCIDGCSYDLFGDEGYDKESNTSVAHGYMKSYGTSCSGPAPKTPDPTVNGTNPSTAPSATDPNASACQAGQVPYTGTVNGKTVTVCGTADKSSSTGSTSTSSSGSTTTNNNGTQTTSNTSGTSGSTSKTTCENGSCTTTTSSNSSSGGGASSPGGTSTSGTETKTEPKEKFCADNPTSPLCKDSNSSFGGGCGAFQCEGDAVQCATARATQELLCATKVSDSDPALLAGQQAVNGGDRPAWHPRSQADSSTFSLASMLDTSPLFGTTGNCIADKTVPMLGKTLTIPFSRMCTALELLGAAFLASCYLGAAYIVFRK